MKKEVTVAKFKSGLSQYLRSVRRGHEIVIKNRDIPVARLLPYQPAPRRLMTIPPTKSLKDIEKLLSSLSPPKNLKLKDLEEALREPRRDRFEI